MPQPSRTRGAAVGLFRRLEQVQEAGGTVLSASLQRRLAGQSEGAGGADHRPAGSLLAGGA